MLLAASSDQECFVLKSLIGFFTFSGDIRSTVIGCLLRPGMFCFRISDWLLLSFDRFSNIVIYTDRQTGSDGMCSVDKNILLTLCPRVTPCLCSSCLLIYLGSLYCKQYGHRSDCSKEQSDQGPCCLHL